MDEPPDQDTPEPAPAFADPGKPASAAQVAEEQEQLRKIRTTDEQAMAFLALVESGMSVRRSASETGINIRTAYGVLARAESDIEDARAALRKLLAGEMAERLDDWRTASRVGAAKRGNHSPAKDWLMHAGLIDPLQGEQPQVRIAINIGTDEKPMRIVSPLSRKAEEE